MWMRAFVLTGLLAFAAAAQHEHAAPATDLGDVQFSNSGNAAAQPHFVRGLLLLHSFEYPPAAAAFRRAQEADPSFAMAFWGEAMTANHPIWGEQQLENARAILGRLGSNAQARRAKAPTEREKAYLHAVEVLYGEGTKKERDAAYSEAMRQIAEKFPQDLDGRAFYALSLLGLSGDVRNVANYMRAAAVAEEVYEQNKRHPGALHYLIHAYDDPVHAPLGLRAARLYSKVAPAASHAQHMPSHIFFSLGMWDEAVASNTDSLHTAHQQGSGGLHPLHWLAYAHLQRGNRGEAEALMKRLDEQAAANPNPYSLIHQAMVRATWLVETGGAGPESATVPVARGNIGSIGAFAGHELARGLTAIAAGRPADAGKALAGLRALREDGAKKLGESGTAPSRFDLVTAPELEAVRIMELELLAAMRMTEGKTDEALRLAQEAAELEDRTEFEYGPPVTVKPPYELYGELLLRAKRPAEAASKFERALQRYPKRRLSVEGLRRARGAATASR
jgi:tetratricopeptide (TPR) repeat protein